MSKHLQLIEQIETYFHQQDVYYDALRQGHKFPQQKELMMRLKRELRKECKAQKLELNQKPKVAEQRKLF